MESVRIDRYVWAVRMYRTRSEATEACRAGHVKVNGSSTKPAHPVHVGDQIIITRQQNVRELEVTQLISTRVGAAIATTCYIDNSPAPPTTQQDEPPFRRDASTGRPTKKERRQLDHLRRS